MVDEKINGNIYDILSREEIAGILRFAEGKETPFLVVDLSKVGQKFDELQLSLPSAKIFYAVKANPDKEVIEVLRDKGSNFDAASIYEIEDLLSLGVDASQISYGNTIKKERDIAKAFEYGIELYSTDALSDLEKIARQAPHSKVTFRILSEGSGSFADWPLSKKFGASQNMVYDLVIKAEKLGLEPYALSFHVGSQQRDIEQWDHCLALCSSLFERVAEEGIKLKALNLGGGFPAQYLIPSQEISTYTKSIETFLQTHFDYVPEIILEPGRSIAGDCGVIVSEVVMVSRKSPFKAADKWVYLDIGKFGGLIETLDESIKYPIFVERFIGKENVETEGVILAGPTCDSYDILYEDFRYQLPKDIKEGDKVLILTTGAYTKSYSAIGFNGFPSLRSYCVKRFLE